MSLFCRFPHTWPWCAFPEQLINSWLQKPGLTFYLQLILIPLNFTLNILYAAFDFPCFHQPFREKKTWLDLALWILSYRGQILLCPNMSASVQFSSVQSLSRVRLFATPWITARQASHQFPEFTQTHVHRVSDAIQPFHLLLSSSPFAFNLSQHQGLFQRVHSLHQVAQPLELQLQHHSFQWIFRVDFFRDYIGHTQNGSLY